MSKRKQAANDDTKAINDQYHDDVMAGLRSAGYGVDYQKHVSRALAFMDTSKIRRPDWWYPDSAWHRHITLRWERAYNKAGGFTDHLRIDVAVTATGDVSIRALIAKPVSGRDDGKVEITKVPFHEAMTIASVLIRVMDAADVSAGA